MKQTVFPRWRGFNLLGMFCSESSENRDFRSPGYYVEEDFKMISDWGFDFVRLPLSYRIWSDVNDPYKIDEGKIAPLGTGRSAKWMRVTQTPERFNPYEQLDIFGIDNDEE